MRMYVPREIGHAGVVGPHCVPSSLEPLQFYDQSWNVLLKLDDDMVVNENFVYSYFVMNRK